MRMLSSFSQDFKFVDDKMLLFLDVAKILKAAISKMQPIDNWYEYVTSYISVMGHGHNLWGDST